MRKTGLFFALINIVCSCFYACDSVCDDGDLFAYESAVENETNSKNKYDNQLELAKYIKFENNRLYIDLSKEKAVNLGIPYGIYDDLANELDKRNMEVQKIIANGGVFNFYNTLADAECYLMNSDHCFMKNVSFSRSEIFGDGGVYLLYGMDNGITNASVIFQFTDYTGYLLYFNSEVIHKETKKKVELIPVEYRFTISGTDINDKPQEHNYWFVGNGNAVSNIMTKELKFPGLLGLNADPHEVNFNPSILYDGNRDSVMIRTAFCTLEPVKR